MGLWNLLIFQVNFDMATACLVYRSINGRLYPKNPIRMHKNEKNAKNANTTPEQLDVLKDLKTKRKGIEKRLAAEMKNKSSGAKAQRGLFDEIDLEESIRGELLESTHQEARIVKQHLEKQRLPNPQSRTDMGAAKKRRCHIRRPWFVIILTRI